MCILHFSLDFCESTEGCFAVSACTEEYSSVEAYASDEEYSLVAAAVSSTPTTSFLSNELTVLISASVSIMYACKVASGLNLQ